jgi:hypothetical protein
MMDSNDLIEYARRAAELGTIWARLEDIRRQSECLARWVRQSKSSLKASILASAPILPNQATVIRGENKLEELGQTTYLALNMLCGRLDELCVLATTTAQHVHALGLRPVAAFGEARALTPRLCAALAELEESTTRAEAQLLEQKKLVVHACCVVEQLILDPGAKRLQKKQARSMAIFVRIRRYLFRLIWFKKNVSL